MRGAASLPSAVASVSPLSQPRSSAGAPDSSPSSTMWRSLLIFTGVFVAACVLLFAHLGSFPLFNPDEALYAEPAREMLESGEYVTTFLNYMVRFTKPPLLIWTQALSFHLFGINEFAARFACAASGALLVACTYLFVERYHSRKSAILSAFALMTAPLFLGTAREAITDMPLSLLIGGSLMAFFHAFEQKTWRWLVPAYALIGLAVMTKGPVGLILTVSVLALYHLLRGDVWPALKFYRPWFGLVLVALIAVPWFALEIYVTKGAYYNEFLVRENFQRFTSVVDHPGPWYYHLLAVFGGFMPWSVFLPGALFIAAKQWREPNRRLLLFCGCWAAVVVAFFSASVSKLIPYTMPAFPAIATLIGIYVAEALERKNLKELVPPMVLLVAAAAGALLGSVTLPKVVAKLLRDYSVELVPLTQSALCVLLAITLVATATIFRGRAGLAIGSLICGIYVCLAGFGPRVLALVSNTREGPIPTYARYAGLSKWPLFVYHKRMPSVTFYAGRQVIIPTREELLSAVNQTNGAYIISGKVDVEFLKTLPRVRLLNADGSYVLMVQKPAPGIDGSKYNPVIRPQ